MRFFKKLFKIVGILVLLLLVTFIVLIHVFFKLKSEEDIKAVFRATNHEVYVEIKQYEDFSYKYITTQEVIDSTLPNLVFVHGSPGSSLDYKRYLKDEDLNRAANLIAYERIGYGLENAPDIQSLSFETAMLNAITKDMNPSKTIVFGYSYGGPIALGSLKNYKKVVLCAPALFSEVEPMFWFLNLYKFPLTRVFIPKALKAAAKEKLQHRDDLKAFETQWDRQPSEITIIHGDEDWIVPYANTELLMQQFDEEQLEVITLEGTSHDLIWTRYDELKDELLKAIKD